MSIPNWKREKAIKKLFDYEESHNIPTSKRYTYDQYAKFPGISQVYPRKIPNMDIRRVFARLEELGLWTHK